MTRTPLRAAGAGRAPRPAVERLEDRLAPATFSFAGFTFEQDSTPDVKTALAPGTYDGAVVTAAPTTASASVAFPDAPATGFDPALALGALVDPTAGPRALNLPAGDDGTAARSGVELSWSGGRGLVATLDAELVIFEAGVVGPSGSAAPEAYMVQGHNATAGTWSPWFYLPAEAAAAFGGTGTEGAFATRFHLGQLRVFSGEVLDRIRIVNMTDEDRMASPSGFGEVIPGDAGATSAVRPNPGALASFAAYDAATLDPDPLYVGVFNEVSPLVDLTVTKTDNATSVNAGQAVTYTVVVSNAGPNAADGTTLVDSFPPALTGVTWTSSATGGATGNSPTGSGNISETLDLPAGSSVAYTITGTLSASASGTLSNTAAATLAVPLADVTPADNSATDTSQVVALVDLSVTKTGPGFANPGQVVTYTVVARNVGQTAVAGARVVDVVPVLLTNVTWTSVSAGGATGSAGSGTGSIDETLNLPVGSSVAYTLVGTVPAFGGFINTATVSTPAGVTDNDTGNNTASVFTSTFPFRPPFVPPVRLFAVGADAGASGHVKVYNADGSLRLSFIAFEGFDGGVRVATGHVNGDHVEDVIVGAGPGAPGGHVKVFDGNTGALVASFFAFPGFTGGVDVAVGDVDASGRSDIIVGTGPGAAHVKAFDFGTGAEVVSFIAYDNFFGGVTVAAGDFYGFSPGTEILTGVASGGPAHVKVFTRDLQTVVSFITYDGYLGGIDVATGGLFSAPGAFPFGGQFATAPLVGTNGDVRFFAGPSGQPLAAVVPFPGRPGGLRIGFGEASSTFNVDDLIVGSGPGNGSLVKAFDSVTLAELSSFTAFEGFDGGVFVG